MTPKFPKHKKRTPEKHRCSSRRIAKRIKLPARQIEKELGLMQSIITHDILNQLTALQGFLSLMEMADSNTDLKRFIRNEQKIAETLQVQVQFMRNLQKSGKLSPAWHDVDQDIRRIIDVMHLSSEISIDVQGRGFEVFTDPLLASVFYGLMVNSLMHGETVNTIDIHAEESKGSLSIVYEDNGCGIEERNKENIFLKGYGRNTGLGLYLIREILAANQMSITENGEPGKGARFVIIVPQGLYRRRAEMCNEC
jgi:Signal transduction histidine kinase